MGKRGEALGREVSYDIRILLNLFTLRMAKIGALAALSANGSLVQSPAECMYIGSSFTYLPHRVLGFFYAKGLRQTNK